MADYIEREDLINKLHTLCKINCTHYPAEQDIYCDMCELGDVIKLIKGCPSVDVKPIINPFNNHPICPYCGSDLQGVIKGDG